MAHELDFSLGRAAIAFQGAVPWHGFGETIQPDDTLETIQHKAGIDYRVLRGATHFERKFVGTDGSEHSSLDAIKGSVTLYRSDTGAPLSIVTDRYQVVQPHDVIEFYRDLVERYGYQIEVAGALKGGRKIWALANTKNATVLRGGDAIKGYLLLATSYDGSMSTQARFTSVRVVCNNTLTIATEGRPDVTVPHSTKFDADKVKLDLKIGDAWANFEKSAQAMTQRVVGRDETVEFLMDIYFGLAGKEQIAEFHSVEGNDARVKKVMDRLTNSLFNSPGAHLASARNTLWGVLQAVTHDIDHTAPARTQENRLNKAWFGPGEAMKQRAFAKAVAMAA